MLEHQLLLTAEAPAYLRPRVCAPTPCTSCFPLSSPLPLSITLIYFRKETMVCKAFRVAPKYGLFNDVFYNHVVDGNSQAGLHSSLSSTPAALLPWHRTITSRTTCHHSDTSNIQGTCLPIHLSASFLLIWLLEDLSTTPRLKNSTWKALKSHSAPERQWRGPALPLSCSL